MPPKRAQQPLQRRLSLVQIPDRSTRRGLALAGPSTGSAGPSTGLARPSTGSTGLTGRRALARPSTGPGGRRRRLSVPESDPVPPPQESLQELLQWVLPRDPTTPAPDTLNKPWLRLLQDPKSDFSQIAIRAWADETEPPQGIARNFDGAAFWSHARRILASISNATLQEICFGNLSRARQLNPAVKRELDSNEERNRKMDQPSIYIIELVQKNSKHAPTPNQLIAILQIADRYHRNSAADADVIRRINTWMPTGQTDAPRRYFATRDAPGEYWKLRNTMLALFRNMSEEELDIPLGQPLRDVGYANDAFRRLRQHMKHTGTNYLLGLFEAIACEFWPEKFETVSHIAFLAWEVIACPIGECLLSIIGSSYTRYGLGFNHYPAGLSNTGCWKEDWNWHEIKNATRYLTPFFNRMTADNEKLEKLLKDVKKLGQIDASIKEIQDMIQGRGEQYVVDIEPAQREELAVLENGIALVRLFDYDLDIFNRIADI